MIKIIFMDVDGTLTDGGIYIGNDGEIFKRFNVKDGYGISTILKQAGIIPAIVTGRQSQIVENRCGELGVEDVVQGSSNKMEICKSLLKKYNLTKEDAAYIGDDINDYEAMKMMAVKGCPSDACEEIKEIADFVSTKSGGNGAVREFIEWMVSKKL